MQTFVQVMTIPYLVSVLFFFYFLSFNSPYCSHAPNSIIYVKWEYGLGAVGLETKTLISIEVKMAKDMLSEK